eukprot:g17370.t1
MVRHKASLLLVGAIAPSAFGKTDGNVSKSAQEANKQDAVLATAEDGTFLGNIRRGLTYKNWWNNDDKWHNDGYDDSYDYGSTCSNGISGVESYDGLACCPSECDSCNYCGYRRLTVQGEESGESSRELTYNQCGYRRQRRLTWWYYRGDKDSGDDYDEYCECSKNDYRRDRALTYWWWGNKGWDKGDYGGDSCDCGYGRRLGWYKGDSSDDDCNCECECKCEPEPLCCAEEIIKSGDPCDETGSAPCFFVPAPSTPAPVPVVVCESYTCSAGLELIPDRIPNACFQNVCNDEQCCQPEPVAPTPAPVTIVVCESYTCSAGLELIPDRIPNACFQNVCNDEQCCQPEPVAPTPEPVPIVVCESYACSAGLEPIPDRQAAPCVNNICTDALCCQEEVVEVCPSAGGIAGIENSNGDACCVAECGQCGGDNCATAGPASDCCDTDILEFGEPCSETNEAPCFIGVVDEQDTDVVQCDESVRLCMCLTDSGGSVGFRI